MDQDRWQTINRIFHAALDLSPGQRIAFVLTAAGDDIDLRSEIERLLDADEKAGSYLESPLLHGALLSGSAHTSPPLKDGDLVSSRFLIGRTLGEGGMGHVFEAFDTDLGVAVALKVIRPEFAENAEALTRFKQEVRLAHSITHPNVCRTYDMNRDVIQSLEGHSRELVFLTMEFLQGETLATRIKRVGALGLDEAFVIARQLASALTAAQSLGIVHRDIKPANVMLVPDQNSSGGHQRAVITDFGLARLETTAVQPDLRAITRSYRPIGTLAYMAPEQLQSTDISPVTDIYAFGLLLFEMITGRRAFDNDNAFVGLAERLTGLPPSPRTIVPNLPDQWQRAIAGCLHVHPTQRWQSASDVIAVLEGQSVKSRGKSKSYSWKWVPRNPWTLGKKVFAASILFLTTVSLSFVFLRLYGYWGNPPVAPGALVYLTHVKNETGEKAFDNLTELVQAGLTQSAHINLLDESRAGDILQQMTKPPDTVIDEPIARQIAMRAGAARVIFATVKGLKGRYRLEVDIQQPDAGDLNRFREHWRESFPWESSGFTNTGTIPQSLLTAVRHASSWIRHEAGESAHDIARLDAPPEDVTTGSWEALEDFSEAKRLLAKHDKEAAIRALQSATVADPHFAMAFAELANNLMSVFRTEEALHAYNKAISVEMNGRLSSRERYFIIASHASDTNDFQVAADAFKSYTDLYPNDYFGWFYLAYPLRELGREDDALLALSKSLRLMPDGAGTRASIAITYIAMDKTAEARPWSRQLEEMGFKNDAHLTYGLADFLDAKYGEAETHFRALRGEKTPVFDVTLGYSLLARVFAERGDTQDALSAFDQGITDSERRGDRGSLATQLLDKAYVLCDSQDVFGCFSVLDKANAESLSPHLILLESFVLGTRLATEPASIQNQRLRRLRALNARLEGRPNDVVVQIAVHRIAGEIAGLSNNWQRALVQFKAADGLDAVNSDRAYLARALIQASLHEASAVKAARLRTEAALAYLRTVDHPGHIWHLAWEYPPGILGDEIRDYLALCKRAVSLPQSCEAQQTKYDQLRPKYVSERHVAATIH